MPTVRSTSTRRPSSCTTIKKNQPPVAKYTNAAAYAEAQRQLLTRVQRYQAPFEIAVRDSVARQVQRIFNQGLNSDGRPIGTYEAAQNVPGQDGTGLYVNPKKTSPRAVSGVGKGGYQIQGLLPTRGKPSTLWLRPTDEYPDGEHIFTERTYRRGAPGTKPGDPHRTTWLASYKDYRNRVGRRIDRVDLNLTGDLLLDFATQRAALKAVTRGGSLEVKLELKRTASPYKVAAAEEKYGRIFALTLAERQKYFEVLLYEIRKTSGTGGPTP